MFGRIKRKIKKHCVRHEAYAQQKVNLAKGDKFLENSMNYWEGQRDAYATILRNFFK